MNIIDLATKTMQTAIQTAITGVRSVVDATKTKVDSTATKVDAIDVKVGTLLDGRVVKSIQRGSVAGNRSASLAVSIATVNPDKCAVLLDGTYIGYNDSSYSYAGLPYLLELTSNNLTIGSPFGSTGSGKAGTISWQVIEFY